MAHGGLFERYVKALTNPDALAGVLATDFSVHDLPNQGDRNALIAFRHTVVAAFPDQRSQIADYLENGDRVAARIMSRQTHTGAFAGIKPTG